MCNVKGHVKIPSADVRDTQSKTIDYRALPSVAFSLSIIIPSLFYYCDRCHFGHSNIFPLKNIRGTRRVAYVRRGRQIRCDNIASLLLTANRVQVLRQVSTGRN